MNRVPLGPADFRCSRLRPPSRLEMNSLRSALTAVLAGLPDPPIRAKGNYELVRPMDHNRKPEPRS
jgi:hypothetical protein